MYVIELIPFTAPLSRLGMQSIKYEINNREFCSGIGLLDNLKKSYLKNCY